MPVGGPVGSQKCVRMGAAFSLNDAVATQWAGQNYMRANARQMRARVFTAVGEGLMADDVTAAILARGRGTVNWRS